MSSQTPTCLVFDRLYEQNTLTGFDALHGFPIGTRKLESFLGGLLGGPQDVSIRSSQAITLYHLTETLGGTVYHDLMVPALSPHNRVNVFKTHYGGVSQRGIPVEIPYFIGNDRSQFHAPSIRVRLFWNVPYMSMSNVGITASRGDYIYAFLHGDVPEGEKGYHDVVIPLPIPAETEGVAGRFYHYRFWLGLTSNDVLNHIRYDSNVEPTTAGAQPRYGLSWLVLGVNTQMPKGYNFEFALQHQSFLPRGWRVMRNSNPFAMSQHIGHATSRAYGPVGFSAFLNQNVTMSLDSFWSWESYSQNSSDRLYLNAFWWCLDIKTQLAANYRFKLPPFICNTRTIPIYGTWSAADVAAGNNVPLNIGITWYGDEGEIRHAGDVPYLKCIGTDYYQTPVSGLFGLTWQEDDEVNMEKAKVNLAYNSVCILRLVEGPAFSDVTETTVFNRTHKTVAPFTCLYPYPYTYPPPAFEL